MQTQKFWIWDSPSTVAQWRTHITQAQIIHTNTNSQLSHIEQIHTHTNTYTTIYNSFENSLFTKFLYCSKGPTDIRFNLILSHTVKQPNLEHWT